MLGNEDSFGLAFLNVADEIQRTIQPYCEQTTVAEPTDLQQLYDLQHRFEAFQVFWASEISSSTTSTINLKKSDFPIVREAHLRRATFIRSNDIRRTRQTSEH